MYKRVAIIHSAFLKFLYKPFRSIRYGFLSYSYTAKRQMRIILQACAFGFKHYHAVFTLKRGE